MKTRKETTETATRSHLKPVAVNASISERAITGVARSEDAVDRSAHVLVDEHTTIRAFLELHTHTTQRLGVHERANKHMLASSPRNSVFGCTPVADTTKSHSTLLPLLSSTRTGH